MLIAIVGLQLLLVVLGLAVYMRLSRSRLDPRLSQVPDQMTRLDVRFDGLERHVQAALVQLRGDLAAEAASARDGSSASAAALRGEILRTIQELGTTLSTGLDGFRADNQASSETLRRAVSETLNQIGHRLMAFTSDAARTELEARNALHTRLHELAEGHALNGEKLRASVQERLDHLTATNTAKLEEMRLTVDEKLQKTLESRLTASFGQVSDHLGKVQEGLGEMKALATGVGDLKKVLSNVSRRGGVGEFLVAQQLEQMFSAEQYLKQCNIRPETREVVDFALKVPSGEPGTFMLLPIDSKFPVSDWERLEHAYDHGSADEIATAGRAFERAIRVQARSICDKYIDPPTTMPHAIMVLPTESLYAEVVRRPGLLSEIQQGCRVTIAGPSTFMAILTSFQMGFHTLAIQKKGDEVWRTLAKAKVEFGNFNTLMDKVGKQVGTVQTTLKKIKSKTTTINRALKDVSTLDAELPPPEVGFEEFSNVAPLLAALSEKE